MILCKWHNIEIYMHYVFCQIKSLLQWKKKLKRGYTSVFTYIKFFTKRLYCISYCDNFAKLDQVIYIQLHLMDISTQIVNSTALWQNHFIYLMDYATLDQIKFLNYTTKTKMYHNITNYLLNHLMIKSDKHFLQMLWCDQIIRRHFLEWPLPLLNRKWCWILFRRGFFSNYFSLIISS